MTYAPDAISKARLFLIGHLDIHENSSAYRTDLDPAEVGIVGGPDHFGGYHCGKDRVVDGDYSVVESKRDRSGLSGAASAIDIGWFEARVGGRVHNTYSLGRWLSSECAAGAADTKDIREVIYSPDGQRVKRWDRLGVRTSGDDSHLWHIHISYFRDSEARDKTALFRRYLTEIDLLEGDVTPDDIQKIADAVWRHQVTNAATDKPVAVGSVMAWMDRTRNAQTAAILAAIGSQQGDDVDEQAIVAGVLDGLSPEAIAAGIPEDIADQVAQKLADRLAA